MSGATLTFLFLDTRHFQRTWSAWWMKTRKFM